MNVTVIVPSYNGGNLWKQSACLLAEQIPSLRVKVIDSSSEDDTREIAQGFGFEVEQIDQKDFDHGGTRSYSLEDVNTEFVVFLTQDVLLEGKDAIAFLVSVFDKDPEIVCAYGCQLPHVDANPLAQHARYNSYKPDSYVTSLTDDFPTGFRKAFLSNSFAAYRVDFLRSIGGFPRHLILGEDAYVAAKALVANKKVAYVAEAKVRHSHNYSVIQEFKRYFDIGVFHSTQSWMIDELGSVEGEGVKFAVEQLRYVCKVKKHHWLILSIFTSMAKFIGYKLGKKHQMLGVKLSRKLSMYKSYWNRV
ncbi:O-antigen biosynthesis protein [Marinomonas sp. CT5]|uniref:glycosyltransferase family 2 protein n=1 Tax=Marinomonas sp. CT5 TaxID=2066133 RepID=UPI001BB0666F|nr:glycosyltransferase family A protein [Marinomonas sp. CT5]QUX94549.1 O-antigen biosynthesis protein [Marinomonas sp. CT5]